MLWGPPQVRKLVSSYQLLGTFLACIADTTSANPNKMQCMTYLLTIPRQAALVAAPLQQGLVLTGVVCDRRPG